MEIPRSEMLPPYLVPQTRPPPKSPDNLSKKQEVESSKIEIEENLPFQESIIFEVYERPDKSYFQEPIELKDLIDTNNIIQQFLPKQTDIDKLLEVYPTILGKETALLAIPEICADNIITWYHSNLFAGHQGVIKMYLMISDRFYIPNLMHYLRSYIKGCHICQLNRKDKLPERHLQLRINLNYRPLSRLSMDLTVMLTSYKGDRYILCVIDEVTNYIVTAPMKHAKAEEIGEILINSVFSKCCVPDYIIMDLDSAFMSSLMSYLFKKLGIK